MSASDSGRRDVAGRISSDKDENLRREANFYAQLRLS